MNRFILALMFSIAVLWSNFLAAQEVPVQALPKRTTSSHYLQGNPQPPFTVVLASAENVLTPKLAPPINTAPPHVFVQNGSPMAWTLDQIIAATLTSDPKLRIGKEDIRQAKAEYVTSSLLPNPEFSVEGGTLPIKRITEKNAEAINAEPPEFGLQIEFPIDWFLFAKRKAAMNSAKWEVCQAQAEYADLIRERITETAVLFYDVLEAKALLVVAQGDVEILTRLEKIAKEGVAAGGIPAVEWKRITLDLLQSRQELLETEKTLDVLKAQLRAQFGCTDYDPAFDITGDLDAPTHADPMPLEAAFEMAKQNRPDIRALRLQVFKSKADVHMENRNAYPEVSTYAGYTQFPQHVGIRDNNYNSWGIGLTVTVPVFDRNQGNRARARSALAQSNHQLQSGMVNLRAEIVEADRDFRTAHQQTHTIADEEVCLTTEVRDIMLEGFRAGGCPLIDVLDAERSYRETMRLFVTSRANYWRAMYIYNSVVGINSHNDVRSPAH